MHIFLCRGGGGLGGETGAGEHLWHLDGCLTLEETNHQIEVQGMMGCRLPERGGGEEGVRKGGRGVGRFKCKSFSYKKKKKTGSV